MIRLEMPDRFGEQLSAGIAIGSTGQIGVPAKKTVTPRKELNRVGHARNLYHVSDGNTAPVEPTNAADNDQETGRGLASVVNTTT
jgi:hypothetical protein